jgi:Flp pilus assembly protein TadB
MAPFVNPTLAVISAIVALASLVLYLQSSRRSEKDSAREEALALAETRRQLVAELRAALRDARAEARDNLIVLRSRLEQSPPDVEGALASIRRLLDREVRSPRASI